MSLSFLGKKGFHPSNPKNMMKLFEAEQKKAKEEKAKEELQRQYKDEAERRENRGMLNKTFGVSTGPERTADMAFMEQLPPGMAEAIERQKGGKTGTRAERDAEKFEILKNAPRRGDFTNDLDVTHKPFGVNLKKTKCTRCQQWGHSLGDRECPMRDVIPGEEERKSKMDPLARLAGLESSGAPLRWALKGGAVPGEGVHGRAAASDANQQFVVDEQEQQAASHGAALADIDPALLAALSEKQQKKLVKMYTAELRSAALGEEADEEARGDKKRKRKEKREKREKKEKKHKKKKRKHSDSDGSGDSGSD